MPVRPCLGLHDRPCSRLTSNGSRCPDCAAEMVRRRSASRGTRQQQGYGADWYRVQRFVLRRDRHVCHYCGGVATTGDHLVPKSRGGSDDPENLVAACVPCNSAKRDRTAEEFLASRRGRSNL